MNDFTLIEKFLFKIKWYEFCRLFNNWIYPGYDLKNLLFHRHDRIKVPQIKPWEYCDTTYFMLCANMQMIVNFIEKENPEKHICWYKDKNGVDCGHKYGEYEKEKVLFLEYNGKWVMDIIKEIYNYWKVIYPKQIEYKEELMRHLSDNLIGEMKEIPNGDGFYHVEFDKSNCVKTIDDLSKRNVNWTVLCWRIENKEHLLNEKIIMEKLKDMEKEIEDDCQKYLHLAIEMRPYLWT